MSLDLKALRGKLENAVEAGLKKVGVMSSGSSFFSGARKGESAELQSDLNSNSRLKQVNALKRIIANMSLGRDVSQLFPDVVKLGQSTNLETKKLVYLYVLSNARLQPEKALLAVNTFLLDCHTNASPIIRALAIRTMLCLRVDSVLDYLVEPLKKALTVDGDPYVRKTAAIGVLKLFHQAPRTMEDHGFLPTLVQMVGDSNPVVASNAAAALHEIVSHRGANASPLSLPPRWADKLLHTLGDCSEWGQVYVLDLLSAYHEPAEDQVEMTIERVLPRLSHLNAAVVLAAVKCVLKLLRLVPGEQQRAAYMGRVNSALVTLSRTDPDTQYVVIKNIQALLPFYPTLLRDKIDGFFVRYNDPLCVKKEKLRLLMSLLHESNADKIVKELAEYATDVDPAFLSRVVHATSVASIKQPRMVDRCISQLHGVAEKQKEMMPAIFVAAKNLLRRHPEKAKELMNPLLTTSSGRGSSSGSGSGLKSSGASSESLAAAFSQSSRAQVLASVEDDLEATVALVWILGEFCDVLPNGMETLDHFTGSFVTLEPAVQNAVMTAMVKLFLRNPAQVERLLTPLFETATKSSLDPDVRDRAFMYYRLLAKGIGAEKMKALVHSSTTASAIDVDERRSKQRQTVSEVLSGLNSAATVLEMPAKSFMLPYGLRSQAAAAADDGEDDEPLPDVEVAPGAEHDNKAAAGAAGAKPKGGASLDDLFSQGGGGGGGGGGSVAATAMSGQKKWDDDIFGGASSSSSSQHQQQQQQAPKKNDIDPFAHVSPPKKANNDPFGDQSASWDAPKPATSSSSSSPAWGSSSSSLPIVARSGEMTIRAAFSLDSATPTLSLCLEGGIAAGLGRGGANISTSPNELGLTFANERLSHTSSKVSGTSASWSEIGLYSTELSFGLQNGPNTVPAGGFSIPMSLQATTDGGGGSGGGAGQSVRFNVPVPMQMVFAPVISKLEPPDFARQWNTLDTEKSFDLGGHGMKDDVISKRLERIRGSVTASTTRGSTAIVLATLRTHTGVTVLVELRTSAKGSLQCTMRCGRLEDCYPLVAAVVGSVTLASLPDAGGESAAAAPVSVGNAASSSKSTSPTTSADPFGFGGGAAPSAAAQAVPKKTVTADDLFG